MKPTLALASDHAGLALKSALIPFLSGQNYAVMDLGTNSDASCDYPDYAHALSAYVLKQGCRGILICGSGIGMSIAANRHGGIRAALVRSPEEAELARRHNDANVLCLGARLTAPDVAMECVQRFLDTAFEEGRHTGRVLKLSSSGRPKAGAGDPF